MSNKSPCFAQGEEGAQGTSGSLARPSFDIDGRHARRDADLTAVDADLAGQVPNLDDMGAVVDGGGAGVVALQHLALERVVDEQLEAHRFRSHILQAYRHGIGRHRSLREHEPDGQNHKQEHEQLFHHRHSSVYAPKPAQNR